MSHQTSKTENDKTMLCEPVPGPWEVALEGLSIFYRDESEQRQFVCLIPNYKNESKQKATAALIAAAPDLLFALELLINEIQDRNGVGFCECGDSPPVRCNACVARIAIGKATYIQEGQ